MYMHEIPMETFRWVKWLGYYGAGVNWSDYLSVFVEEG